MAEEIGLFEAMYTQRALRYIKPDPVPDELIRKVIEAGTRAPSGGNSHALLPLGYPADGVHYGPTNRQPVEEVTFAETWGQKWSARD